VTGDMEIFWIPDFNPDDAAPPPPHSSTDLELGLLERVGGNLLVRDIWGLAQFSFMSSLTDVGGDFTLYGLDNLSGIALSGLERVGGRFQVADALVLQSIELPALTELGGLELRSDAPGELSSLRKVTLSVLDQVEGDLTLYGTSGLYTIEAKSLQTISGALSVTGGCSFVPSLEALQQVGSLELVGNCGLEQLDGLPISTISGQSAEGVSLRIRDNDGLSQEAIDAFVGSLELTGDGEVDVQPADDGACAIAQQELWKTDELWCKE